jgi:hypothetical protein
MNNKAVGAAALAIVAFTTQADAQVCEDRDRDGYATSLTCSAELDCNDDDRYSFPGAFEACDGVDNDCNGRVDDHPNCPVICTNPELILPITNVSQRTTRSLGSQIVWARDAWVVGFDATSSEVGPGCSDLWLTKLARDGSTLIPPTLVAGATASDFAKPEQVTLAWTGSSIGAAWWQGLQSSCSGTGDSEVRFRRFNSLLQPTSSTLVIPGCPWFHMMGYPSLSWGRASFMLAWGETDSPIRFSLVSRDDVLADPCGVPYTNDRAPNIGTSYWNGDHFGVSWIEGPPDVNYTTIFSELYFRRIGEDGSFLEPEPTRVTYDPARTERSTLVWADGEWASAWSDSRTNTFNYFEIYMTRMLADGTAITPPGDIRVSCCNTNSNGSPRYSSRLLWTGGEYGVIYDDLSKPPDKISGDIFFQRVDRNGMVIGSPVLVSNDTQKNAAAPEAAWNGREYGIVWGDYRPPDSAAQIYFARVGCGCTDSDADGFSSCAGRDCVDSNPLVNPLRPETCSSGFDDNCDGKTDCQDTVLCATGPGALPATVNGVRFGADKTTLLWNAAANATSYDVLTGDLTYLLQDHNFSTASCAAWRHPSTSVAVAVTPPKGRGLYFLVRGKADTCRLGSWGTPLRDTVRLTCP